MTPALRLLDYVDQMADALVQACTYVDGMDKAAFLADRRTQQAVVLNLMILGEAASRLLADHPDFVAQHPAVPWRNIKGMRNRIAHGYFELSVDLVWETVRSALPDLVRQMPAIRASAVLIQSPPGTAA